MKQEITAHKDFITISFEGIEYGIFFRLPLQYVDVEFGWESESSKWLSGWKGV